MKFIMIFFSFALAAETYKIAGELVNFKNYKDVEYYCPKKKCDALEALKRKDRFDVASFPKEQFANPLGSDVCRHHYKAKTLLGRNEKLDGRAFCLFPDESMIEINSLTKFAEKRLK